MIGAARLSDELSTFAQIIAALAAIAARTDPGRRSELVTLRKKLSDHIVRMRDIGVQVFNDAGQPTLAHEFRSRLSNVLNLVAMHQANWPAVTIDDGNAAYRQSAAKLAETNRAFIDWTRDVLAKTR